MAFEQPFLGSAIHIGHRYIVGGIWAGLKAAAGV